MAVQVVPPHLMSFLQGSDRIAFPSYKCGRSGAALPYIKLCYVFGRLSDRISLPPREAAVQAHWQGFLPCDKASGWQ